MTDTTLRDAYQSLMATRMPPGYAAHCEATSVLAQNLFSLEDVGDATFDVAYRFLHESPGTPDLRTHRISCFQMLIRGANAVDYKNYPDNIIRKFVKHAGETIDVFRILSLNWMKG